MPAFVSSYEVDATPPAGHPLCLGILPPAMRIVNPLRGRGIFLQPENDEPIVICVLDWLFINNESHDYCCEKLAEAADTSIDRISVHATHPHDTPGTDLSSQKILDKAGLKNFIYDQSFEKDVVDRMCDALFKSKKSLLKLKKLLTMESNPF